MRDRYPFHRRPTHTPRTGTLAGGADCVAAWTARRVRPAASHGCLPFRPLYFAFPFLCRLVLSSGSTSLRSRERSVGLRWLFDPVLYCTHVISITRDLQTAGQRADQCARKKKRPQERSRRHPDSSGEPQDGPRRAKRAPRDSRERPRRPPNGPREPQDGPRWRRDGPRELPKNPKTRPDSPRRPQKPTRGPKRPPRSPQQAPRQPHAAPGAPRVAR